jgi:hypothetical protein
MFTAIRSVLKIIFIAFLLFLKTIQLSAQTEYLVTVDPSNGNFTKIDSIPGVKWILLFSFTTIDEKNKQFFFVGGPTQTEFYLLTLDAVSGKILHKVPKPDNLMGLEYSKSSDKLFGIIGNSGAYSLVSIEKSTGAYTTVANIPGMEGFIDLILDDNNHRIFINGLFNGAPSLRTVDLLTGNTISTVFSNKFGNFVYDNLSNTLYCLYSRQINPNNPIGFFSLVSFDPLTGNFSITGDLPEGLGITQGNTTYNENAKQLIFVGNDNGTYFLYSVNITTGQIIYKVPAKVTSAVDQDNLIQFRFDNSTNKLYALHWEAKTIRPITDSSCKLNNITRVYPNPFPDLLVIEKDQSLCKIYMSLYNSFGQKIISTKLLNDGKNNFYLQKLPAGTYFYNLFSDKGDRITGKVIKR